MVGSILGNRVRRVEDPDLITGRSTYVDDLRIARHRRTRSSCAARSRTPGSPRIDTSEAERPPACSPCTPPRRSAATPVPSFAEVNEQVGHGPLADGVVRYVGDPVALVVAETRAQAVDAAELVDVDYDELAVVVDMEAGARAGRAAAVPRGRQQHRRSRCARCTPTTRGDVLADAEVVVRARIENQRIATAPIEGNAILVDPRPDGDVARSRRTSRPSTRTWRATCWSKYTGLEKDQLRVVAPHVGGAFGGKAGISYTHGAIVAAARRWAGRWPGPRPAARRCSRCTAAARCSSPSSG